MRTIPTTEEEKTAYKADFGVTYKGEDTEAENKAALGITTAFGDDFSSAPLSRKHKKRRKKLLRIATLIT